VTILEKRGREDDDRYRTEGKYNKDGIWKGGKLRFSSGTGDEKSGRGAKVAIRIGTKCKRRKTRGWPGGR